MAHDQHHLMQYIVRVSGRYADTHGLEPRPNTGQGPAVVGTQFGHRSPEAALPLGYVVGDVGNEIGVTAVRLAHDSVLVIAKVGGAQP